MPLLLSRVIVAAVSYGEEAQPRREVLYIGGEYANFTVPLVGHISSLQTMLIV
jgi:hypothetical protein